MRGQSAAESALRNLAAGIKRYRSVSVCVRQAQGRHPRKRPPEDRHPRYPVLSIAATSRRRAATADINGDRAHSAAPRWAAISSARRVATSCFERHGQSSVLMDEMNAVRSPPNVPVSGETSLARIQSHSLRRAFRPRVQQPSPSRPQIRRRARAAGSPPGSDFKMSGFSSAPEQAGHCRPSSFFRRRRRSASQRQPPHTPQHPPATRPRMPTACPP